MIVFSDNNAMQLATIHLLNFYPEELSGVFADLNLNVPNEQAEDYMTAKEYASLFRVLYSATYLSREKSEAALALLGLTDFRDGLVAGVPSDIFVAHKFGERGVRGSDGEITHREFHDCGIVYYPGHPYLLCVMTKGGAFPILKKRLRRFRARPTES